MKKKPDHTKINLFGLDGIQHVCHEPGQDYHSECIVPTVKHRGGSEIIWGFMSAKGFQEITFIDGTMNSCGYTKIMSDKLNPSLQNLGRRGIFQHNNDPKHTAKITQEFLKFLKKEKVKTMTWPSLFPDLNPIEYLWGILKREVERHNTTSKEQLKESSLKNGRTPLWKFVQHWYPPCRGGMNQSSKIKVDF